MQNVLAQLKVQAGTDHELAPVMHTPFEVLDTFLAVANIQPGECVLEVGCADGRILRHVRENTEAGRVIGVEVEEAAYEEAVRALASVEPEITLLREDIFQAELPVAWEEVDVCYMYLTVAGMKQFWPFLMRKMRAGSRIVAIQFPAPLGEEPDAEDESSYTDHLDYLINFKFRLYNVTEERKKRAAEAEAGTDDGASGST